MKTKIEITKEDVLDFIDNSNKKVRNELIEYINNTNLPDEFKIDRVRTLIPAKLNKDGTVRKGSIDKFEWKEVLVPNKDIETIVEKEIDVTWEEIENELITSSHDYSNNLTEYFEFYKDDNVIMIKVDSLSQKMLVEDTIQNLGLNVI